MDVIELLERMNDFLNQSYLFRAFKFFLTFYLIVISLSVVGIAIRIWNDYTSALFKGAGYKPELGKFQKRWNKVNKQIEKEDSASYAIAVLECSQMLNEVLKAIGYEGDNLGERLNNISSAQIEDIEKLKVVNEVKNKLVQDPGFKISQREAEVIRDTVGRVLDNYEMIEFDGK
jgi:hypothetical protein